MEANTRPNPVSFRDACLFWLKLGFIGFGGPAGQIAILHGELVERRRVDETGMLRRNAEHREPPLIVALVSGQRDPTAFLYKVIKGMVSNPAWTK